MITTSWTPRSQRLLIGAFVLSALLHLFGGALWADTAQLVARIMHRLPEQHKPEQEIATSDVVRLEHRTVPRPTVASRARPARSERVVRAADQPVGKPLAKPTTSLVSPAPAAAHSARPRPSGNPEMAHHVRRAPILIARPPRAAPTPVPRVAAAMPSRPGALTAQQIARLDTQFAQTIAATHVDLATIQKRTQEQPAATIQRPLQFTGVQATLTHGEGYIEPITPGERVGSFVYYYAHYTYMWPDGHLEDDDIPWPFRYPIARDLFAEHVRLIPLQLPPPGYHLTRALKPFLAHFVGAAGQS